jgi:acyl dehydratase
MTLSMDGDELAGTELPSGSFAVEDWKAFLWADATRDDEAAFRYDEAARTAGEDGQLVPHSMAQHIAFEATGGIEATMATLSDDWQSGAALGQLGVEFHDPLETGQPLKVAGRISNVEETKGSSGALTIVTLSYEAETPAGDPVFEMDADMVLMEDP